MSSTQTPRVLLRERARLGDARSAVIAWAPDGRALLRSDANVAQVVAWSLDGEATRAVDVYAGIDALCLSPDGRTLAAITAPGDVEFWDLATGEHRAPRCFASLRATALAWSADGAQLLIASVIEHDDAYLEPRVHADRVEPLGDDEYPAPLVEAWNPFEERSLWALRWRATDERADPTTELALVDDTVYLARTEGLYRASASTHRLDDTLPADPHRWGPRFALSAPHTFAHGYREGDHALCLWDLHRPLRHDERPRHLEHFHPFASQWLTHPECPVSLDPRGRFVALGDGRTVKLYARQGLDLVAALSLDAGVTALRFAPGGDHLALCLDDGTAAIVAVERAP